MLIVHLVRKKSNEPSPRLPYNLSENKGKPKPANARKETTPAIALAA
jgi:hypothetical protein